MHNTVISPVVSGLIYQKLNLEVFLECKTLLHRKTTLREGTCFKFVGVLTSSTSPLPPLSFHVVPADTSQCVLRLNGLKAIVTTEDIFPNKNERHSNFGTHI